MTTNQKIDEQFTVQRYNSAGGTENYTSAVEGIWLWQSETIIFEKYFQKNDNIIDVGCWAGRTTFNLYTLGYKNLTGLDLSENLIAFAQNYAKQYEYNIPFLLGNALQLPFETGTFDNAIFSFNGLMTIPSKEKRLQAMQEIRRVMKKDGIFIFTTHDREDISGEKYFEYWKQEKELWENNKQDPRLFELGDRLTLEFWTEFFIHIANQSEVKNLIQQANFTLIETIMRRDISEENEKVKNFSAECRFWIVKKTN